MPTDELIRDPKWVLVERGRYTLHAPWGATLLLERRRGEGAEPAGWYLFGDLPTGAWLDGRLMAEFRDDAMAETAAWVRGVDGPTTQGPSDEGS